MRRAGLRGWKIASIRGVDLKIHFSLLFLLFYVVLIASFQFPFVLTQSGIDPSTLTGSPLLWGTIFAFGLFLSVVIHEMAHVVMAQSMGVRVEGITLMMLGGVSEMERIPEEPLAEFKVSIVGPLTSFVIAGALFLLRANAPNAEIAFFSYWLARVNIVLGIFNLLPAFPLDGGRAFRSLLATRIGMARATHTTVRVAKAFAWVLGILGFLSFNLLLMLIAIFVYMAANSELIISVSRGMLKSATVQEALTEVDPIEETDSLQAAAEKMIQTRHRILPVQTASGIPAIVTVENFRQVPRTHWSSIEIGQVMDRVGRYLQPDDRLDETLPELSVAGALPVKSNGAIVGIVTYRDIAELLELKSLSDTREHPFKRAA